MEELQRQMQELPGTVLPPTVLQSWLRATVVTDAHGSSAHPGGSASLTLGCGVLGGSTRHLGDGRQAAARADPEVMSSCNDGQEPLS